MADTLFVQFYHRTSSHWFDLGNGFSDTWQLCGTRGDFFWVDLDMDPDTWYDPAAYKVIPLPLEKGRVYVSASYVNHLYQALVWARAYPNIEFVVGGPVAAESDGPDDQWNSVHFLVEGELPKNLHPTGQSMESILGVEEFSQDWHLELPEELPGNGRIYFSYTLENQCYWKKCPFCSIGRHARAHHRKRQDLALEFKHLSHAGHKIVRLNTGSMVPEQIRAILPRLPVRSDMEYRFFMRAARAETLALESVASACGDNIPDCTLGFGIEFPSDRMWKYLNKGTRMEEVLTCFDLCRELGFKVNANMILGWNILTPEDLGDLEGFMDRLDGASVTTLQLRWLFAHPHTPIHGNYAGGEAPLRLGPFNCGFHVKVDEKQRDFNLRAGEIIQEGCQRKGIRLEGFGNLDHLKADYRSEILGG